MAKFAETCCKNPNLWNNEHFCCD